METTPTPNQKEATMWLTLGTPLAGGVVTAMTLTAYAVELLDGTTTFVPFTKVHPLAPATPLVRFDG